MIAYAVRRILFSIPVLLGVSILIFLMVRLMPGSIVDVLQGTEGQQSEAERQAVREQLGLNGSYPEQYLRWLGGVFRGDFGTSIQSNVPVSEILLRALPITLEIMILALLIALVIGIPLGVVSAIFRDRSSDYGARVTALIGISVPSFWLATLLLMFTSRVFEWVPPYGHISFWTDPIDNLSQFILPALAVSLFTMAVVSRLVRASLLEVLGQDYVRTARAKGLPRRVVVSRHALRNALIPVVTVVGFEIGALIGGAAIVETIFGLPGVGQTLLEAITTRDYPVIQGVTMMIAFVFILANLAVDLLYGVLDPRIVIE